MSGWHSADSGDHRPRILLPSSERWSANSFNQRVAPEMLVNSDLAVTFQPLCTQIITSDCKGIVRRRRGIYLEPERLWVFNCCLIRHLSFALVLFKLTTIFFFYLFVKVPRSHLPSQSQYKTGLGLKGKKIWQKYFS